MEKAGHIGLKCMRMGLLSHNEPLADWGILKPDGADIEFWRKSFKSWDRFGA
jgi:hypothetical protein